MTANTKEGLWYLAGLTVFNPIMWMVVSELVFGRYRIPNQKYWTLDKVPQKEPWHLSFLLNTRKRVLYHPETCEGYNFRLWRNKAYRWRKSGGVLLVHRDQYYEMMGFKKKG